MAAAAEQTVAYVQGKVWGPPKEIQPEEYVITLKRSRKNGNLWTATCEGCEATQFYRHEAVKDVLDKVDYQRKWHREAIAAGWTPPAAPNTDVLVVNGPVTITTSGLEMGCGRKVDVTAGSIE
jgi:hypothetical protein